MSLSIVKTPTEYTMDLSNLIEHCKRGDRKAQSELYSHLYKNLLHIPMRYMNSREEANGIFNQAMIKIFRQIQDENLHSFMGWCSTIVKRTTIDHLRTITNYKKKHFTIADYNVLGAESSVDNILNDLEVEELFQVIQELPNAERTVFSLYEIDGYKHKEVAEIINISESHSKYLLHMAKKLLRVKLEKLGYSKENY